MFTDKVFACLTSLGFWLFLLTLPPFQTGIWIDCESVIVGAYFLYALLGACLLMRKNLERPNGITVLFFMFGLLSFAVAFWAENAQFHWYGAPTLGEGTFMFLGLGVLSLSMQTVLAHNQERILAYSSIVAVLVAASLCVLNHPIYGIVMNADWTPYAFNAFLAQMAIACFAAIIVLPKAARFIALVIMGAIYISANKTAAIFGVLGIVVVFLAGYLPRPEKIYKWSVLFLPAGILLFVLSLDSEVGGIFSSLYSRKVNILVYLNAWQQNPLSLLWGHGWGAYYNFLQRCLPSLPVSLYEKTNWNPNWDGIDRLDFHCMHQGLESLFALGVLGLIVYYWLIFQPFRSQKPQVLWPLVFLGTWLFTAQTSTWFTMPTLWPFALFFFNVVTRNDAKSFVSLPAKPIVFVTVIGSIISGTIVGQSALDYAAPQSSLFYKSTQRKFLPLTGRAKPYALQGFHMGHEWIAMSNDLARSSLKIKKKILNQLDQFLQPEDVSIMLNVGLIRFLNSFKSDYNKLKPSYRDKLEKHWSAINYTIIRDYPERLDLLFEYGTFLLKTGQLRKFQYWLENLKTVNPDHCIVLWLQGIYYAQEKQDIRSAVPFFMKAMQKGVDRWIPIPGYILNIIKPK